MLCKKYHHGDLRAALIAAGMAVLAEGEEPSLREVARRAGVSATAVYRHFPDKGALLGALAEEGLVMLAAAQHEAFEAAGGGLPGFGATGRAYVRFALAHPALFRLIFASGAEPVDQHHEAFRFLLANSAALAPAGTDPQAFALEAWALAHGLAMLMLDRQIAADEATIDKVFDAPALLGR